MLGLVEGESHGELMVKSVLPRFLKVEEMNLYAHSPIVQGFFILNDGVKEN